MGSRPAFLPHCLGIWFWGLFVVVVIVVVVVVIFSRESWIRSILNSNFSVSRSLDSVLVGLGVCLPAFCVPFSLSGIPMKVRGNSLVLTCLGTGTQKKT